MSYEESGYEDSLNMSSIETNRIWEKLINKESKVTTGFQKQLQ